MNINQEVFQNAKWNILQELAKNPQAPSTLAKQTNTSISNITQQLKILEAYGIITREDKPLRIEKSEKKVQTGKPKTVYHITNGMIQLALISHGRVEKKQYPLDSGATFLSTLILTTGPEDAYFLLKFLLTNEDILKRCSVVAFVKSTRENIELFLITDHLEEIRTKFSNVFIQDLNAKTKKIINWTHNEQEVREGLARGDEHFKILIRNSAPLHDPKGIIKSLRIKP